VVVLDVFGREGAARLAPFGSAVLQPLLAHLVPADVEVPYLLPHAAESDSLFLVDPDSIVRPGDLLHHRIGGAEECSEVPVKGGRLHQVEGNELATERDEGIKQRGAAGEGDAGEVNLEELRVA